MDRSVVNWRRLHHIRVHLWLVILLIVVGKSVILRGHSHWKAIIGLVELLSIIGGLHRDFGGAGPGSHWGFLVVAIEVYLIVLPSNVRLRQYSQTENQGRIADAGSASAELRCALNKRR